MTGFVYAISSGGSVKIGWSGDPIKRFWKISTDCPTAPKLLGMVRASKAQEAEVHLLLEPWRVRGEWFRLEGPVAAFVALLPTLRPKLASNRFVALLNAEGIRLIDLARRVGVDKTTATRWAKNRVPSERLIAVEKATGIPRCAIRPDLYPDSPS